MHVKLRLVHAVVYFGGGMSEFGVVCVRKGGGSACIVAIRYICTNDISMLFSC